MRYMCRDRGVQVVPISCIGNMPEHVLFPPPFPEEKSPDFYIIVQFCKLAVISIYNMIV